MNVRGHILYTPRAAESLQSLGHSMVRDLDRIQRPAGHLEEADLESERQPIQHGPPVSYEVRFPLALQTTLNELAERLTAISSLHRENEAFWNWLDEPAYARPSKPSDDAEKVLGWNVMMEDGTTVLGNIEIKARSLIVNVNSAARAERAIAMLCAALGGLVAAPLTQIQTVEHMMAQKRNGPRPASEVPPEIQTKLVHATLDKQYRALLEQPVPMLGNLTPRSAARTKSGREKLAVWLKHLENRSRQPEATDPMTTYDFAWLWRELKVEDLRR